MTKILLIEDDTMLRVSTADFLLEENFDVHCASNGIEGVQIANSIMPDMIICDINMPGLDGYGVFKTLQANESTALIPFIFLTARTEKEDIRAGMLLGVDDYITKPFDFDELLSVINVRLKKRDQLLNISENTIHHILENNVVGMFVLENECFEFINNRLLNLLDENIENTLKQSFTKYVDETSKLAVKEKFEKCKRGIIKKCIVSIQLKTKNNCFIPTDLYGVSSIIGDKVTFTGIIREKNNDNNSIKNTKSIENIDDWVELFANHKHVLTEEQIQTLLSALAPKRISLKNETVFKTLTKREIEILHLICEGNTNTDIAEKLFISQRTVDSHRASLIEKTETQNTAGLIVFAIKHGIVSI